MCVALTNIVERLESGSRPKGGGTKSGDIPSLGAEHLNDSGGFFLDNMKFIPRDYYSSMGKGIIQENDILVVKDGATTGKVAIIRNNFPLEEAAVNEHLFILRINADKYDPQFLSYYLRSNQGQGYLLRGFHGSAQGGITKSFVDFIRIPDVALPTQRRIASLLETCESAIQKRKEANRLTDEFLKSTFLKMFGDPVRNSRRLKIKRFDEVYSSIRYATGSPPQYKETGIPFIRATNIKNGTVVENDLKYISIEDAKRIDKCKLSKGNLVIVRSGVNAGDCAIIPEKFDGSYAAYDLIVELPYHKAVFYNHIMNSPFGKAVIQPLKRRAGQPHLNAEQIGSLKFIEPSDIEMKKFADIVQKVEKTKEKQRESEKELANLFNSLMQRLFKGKL